MNTARCAAPWAAWLLAAGLSGCTIIIEPGLRSKTRTEPVVPPDAAPSAVQPASMGPLAGPDLKLPALLPMPPGPLESPVPPVDQAATLQQRLQAVEEERRAVNMRVAQLEKQLQEKDQGVTHAHYEVEATAEQMKKSRDELLQCKAELAELRAKIRAVEQENRTTIEVLMKAFEQSLEKSSVKGRP